MWEFAICCVLLGDVNEATAKPQPIKVCREVDDLARQYRIQLYDTFRDQRSDYDQRAAVGLEVLKYSRLIPIESSQQRELADWFRAAAAATRLNQTLPPTPQLDWAAVAGAAGGQDARQTLETSSPQRRTRVAKPASSLPWGAAGRLLFGDRESQPPAPAQDALTPTAVPPNELPSTDAATPNSG